MYEIHYTKQFEKDVKKIKKRGYNYEILKDAIEIITESGTLPKQRYKTHGLIGNYVGTLEAHLKPDWLIIWEVTDDTVTFIRTGTHSDLF